VVRNFSFLILPILIPVFAVAQIIIPNALPETYMWKNVGTPGFSTDKVTYTSLACSPTGQVYIAFQDSSLGQKATVMKYDGITWVAVGTPGFSSGHANCIDLAFNSIGIPYIAYQLETGYPYRAYVMKFDGQNWVYVGTSGVSESSAYNISLAISPADEPFIAYSDPVYNYGAAVKKFNGSQWINVGQPGFSGKKAEYISLAIDPSGQPYISYTADILGGKVAVMKFNGSGWVYVGELGISDLCSHYTSLAINSAGQPYVAYTDNSTYSDRATVKKFDGTSWVTVGINGFTRNCTFYLSLAFDNNNKLYLAYAGAMWDPQFSMRASVMKFTDNAWEDVGRYGFSAGDAHYTDLAISPTNQIYVGYSDGGNLRKATVMTYDSVLVSVNDLKMNFLSIFPNPTSCRLSISLNNHKNKEIQIFDFSGKLICADETNKDLVEFNVEKFKIGIYVVCVKSEDGYSLGKFAKVE
jgi:hypothetical protein